MTIPTLEGFLNDVKNHELTIHKDDGVYRHINEIKAQGIEEAINQVAIDCIMYDEDPVIVLTRVSNYADKLRTNHD